MCLKSTLDNMLKISTALTKISLEKMNMISAKFSGDNSTVFSSEGMEEDDSVCEQLKLQITETFLLIIELLLVPRDNESEAKIIAENAESYIGMLTNLVVDLPGYKKQPYGPDILPKFQEVSELLESLKENDLLRKLIICKRAIFE